MNASAFRTTNSRSSYPSDSSVSGQLTANLNNNNSNYAYSYMTRSGYADGYYEWHMSLSGSRAFFYENDEIVLETKILRSILIREYGSYIRVVNKDTCWTAPKPTMDLKITNTGTGRVYFGGYYIKGSGKDTSVTDISRILNLAYATARLSGSVTGLNARTFYALYNYAISLTKNLVGFNQKLYIGNCAVIQRRGQ